jgi:hypothetical protein
MWLREPKQAVRLNAMTDSEETSEMSARRIGGPGVLQNIRKF